MAESPDAGKAAYGVLRLSSIEGNTSHDFDQVRALAMETARETGQVIAVFELVGYAVPPAQPATWLPMEGFSAEGFRASTDGSVSYTPPEEAAPAPADVRPASPPPQSSTPAQPAAATPLAAPPPPETPAAPPEAPAPSPAPAEEEVPWADEANRLKPKYPTVRGVTLPKYADVTATSGPSGPARPETLAAAEQECVRIGGQLDKTVTAWTGLAPKQVNQATMEAVVTILRAWKSK